MVADEPAPKTVEERGSPSKLFEERLAYHPSQENTTKIGRDSELNNQLGWVEVAGWPRRVPKFYIVRQNANQVHEQGNCALLKLPTDLRNRIFELVLSAETKPHRDDQIGAHDQSSTNLKASPENRRKERDSEGKPMNITTRSRRNPAHSVSLLLTCRKVNQEAAIIAFRAYRIACGLISLFGRYRYECSTYHQQFECFPAAWKGSLKHILVTQLPDLHSIKQTRIKAKRLFPNLKSFRFGIPSNIFGPGASFQDVINVCDEILSWEWPQCDESSTIRVAMPLVNRSEPISFPGGIHETMLWLHDQSSTNRVAMPLAYRLEPSSFPEGKFEAIIRLIGQGLGRMWNWVLKWLKKVILEHGRVMRELLLG